MSKGINTDTEGESLVPDEDAEFERELAEKERKEREEYEQRVKDAEDEQRRLEREAQRERDRKIAQDKLDLMKMKAGVADESEEIKEEHSEKRELHGMERVANIWYHDKLWICFGVFIAVVVAIMVIDTLMRENPDISILLICDNALQADQSCELLEQKLEEYTPDLNEDGEVCVQIICCPLNEYSSDSYYTTNSQKFYANLQQGQIIMVLTDSNTDPDYQALMVDTLEEELPDNSYIDEYGLSLNMQFLADEIECSSLPNDVHLCLRRPVTTLDDSLEDMQENYDTALEIFKDIANGLAEEAQACDDPGLSTEPSDPEEVTGITTIYEDSDDDESRDEDNQSSGE